jgi:hypothetical protein
MKTLTRLGCITALSAALSACGTDPVILGEILDSAGDSPASDPTAPSAEPVSVPSADDEPPPEMAPYPASDGSEDSEPPIDPVEAQVVEILRVNCGLCHIGPDSSGDLSDIDDISLMIDRGMIVPGNRDDSPLYVRMENQTMPPAFERQQRPTPGQIDLVGLFIDELE